MPGTPRRSRTDRSSTAPPTATAGCAERYAELDSWRHGSVEKAGQYRARLTAGRPVDHDDCLGDGMPPVPRASVRRDKPLPAPRAEVDDACTTGFRRRGRACHRRSEEHTSELQSLMRISYAVLCLKQNNKRTNT